MVWCNTGLSVIELPLVPYGDRFMYKKTDDAPQETNGP